MASSPSVVFPGTTVGLKIVSAYTGEQVVSLAENGRYEYEVLADGYALEKRSGIIRPSQISDGQARGTIEPGSCNILMTSELIKSTNEHFFGNSLFVDFIHSLVNTLWLRLYRAGFFVANKFFNLWKTRSGVLN